jgi:F-type H+-transporting ATPase subunit b
MFEAETWVAIAFVIFVGVLAYYQVHKSVLRSLDQRRDRIKSELDEARRLKEEAQALLASYRQKKEEVEHEAQAIIAGAQAEAERLAKETATRMEELIGRRTQMAETKIAQAEAQAVADVRAAAADAGVAAAAHILSRTTKDDVAESLIKEGVATVRGRMTDDGGLKSLEQR